MRVRPAVWLMMLGGMAACANPPVPEFPQIEVVPPTPGAIDAVVFLVGDAGNSTAGRWPILRRLKNDIEFWAGSVGRDSAVSVVFLGDIVYPVGIRDRTSSSFETDSARLWGQIGLLDGPNARERKAIGLFLAGNHDWGNMVGRAGVERLQNMEAQLDHARESGIDVRLTPRAGQPGPTTFDVRHNARLVFMDTHWFLQERNATPRGDFIVRVREALEEAGDRHIIMASHHPFASVGAHGTLTPASEAFGLLYLFKKSGTLIQDLNSPVYDELRRSLQREFLATERRPLVFAGGHDHSLQVLKGQGDAEPEWSLVSGAGSKTTPITTSDRLEFGASHLGYMMLLFHRNDAVELYVVASQNSAKQCPEDPEELATCMEEETQAFRLQYSTELAPPTSLDTLPPEPVVRDTTTSDSPRR